MRFRSTPARAGARKGIPWTQAWTCRCNASSTIAAGVPFSWVAADSVYGVGEIEMALRQAGKGYVLGVNAT
jgi:hypothetical protein